jgi:hypothetical protein
MPLSADSSEFADLVTRWLDESATADEAAQLWLCVSKCPDCARELASATRFEAMLGETLKARNIEADARKQLTPAPRGTKTESLRKPVVAEPRSLSMTWLALAAALVALGLITALLWPEDAPMAPKVAHETAPRTSPPPPKLPDSPRIAGSTLPKMDLPDPPAGAGGGEVLLTDRLDRFFLSGVALDQIPLNQALGLLQGQLQQMDYEKTLDLAKLRLIVPAGASARRVTFHSGYIPFLKAVRALAALAGCDVEVSESTITLIMHPGIYPQLAEKRTLSDMLAGRLNADGTAMVEDADRLAGLWEDAMTLGIAVNEDGTAALSRGQWEALRMMSDSRDQVGRIPVPAFAMYVVPTASVPQNRALTPEELAAFQLAAQQQGAQPLATFTPKLAGPNNQDPVALHPSGDDIELTLQPGSAGNSQPVQNSSPKPTATQTASTSLAVYRSSAQLNTVSGAMMTLSADQAASMAVVSSATNGAAAVTVVVIPVTTQPPVTTPP